MFIKQTMQLKIQILWWSLYASMYSFVQTTFYILIVIFVLTINDILMCTQAYSSLHESPGHYGFVKRCE